jgi:aryl-alcohol dehydrogenase-like predicted oxidoreductase
LASTSTRASRRHNFSPAYIRTALERSLARLRTDYVDVLQLHNPPQKLAKDDGVWETLATSGARKVRFLASRRGQRRAAYRRR